MFSGGLRSPNTRLHHCFLVWWGLNLAAARQALSCDIKQDLKNNNSWTVIFALLCHVVIVRFVEVKSYVQFSTCSNVLESYWVQNMLDSYGFHMGLGLTQVEKSPYCRKVIEARIRDGLADPGTILEDITQVTADQLSDVEGCLAGFPCQARWPSLFKVAVCWFSFSSCPGSQLGGGTSLHDGWTNSADKRSVQTLGWSEGHGPPYEPRTVSAQCVFYILLQHDIVLFASVFISYRCKILQIRIMTIQGNFSYWRMLEPFFLKSAEIAWITSPRPLESPGLAFSPFQLYTHRQAASDRNLRLTYCTVNGHQVGAPVGNSVVLGYWIVEWYWIVQKNMELVLVEYFIN